MNVADVEKASYGALIQAYLMLSHLYYQRYESVVEDEVFDKICRRLYEGFDSLPSDHPHIGYISRDALKAGTAYHIKDYPMMVCVAADMWLRSVDDPEEPRRRRFKSE